MMKHAMRCFMTELGTPPDLQEYGINALQSKELCYTYEADNHGVTAFVAWYTSGVGCALWVRPDRRGSRLAMQVWQQGCRIAKKQGIKKLTIAVDDDKLRLWERRGFRKVHTVMEKTL